jgi:DNA-binding winged helix-turn-helix (wHTH) protein
MSKVFLGDYIFDTSSNMLFVGKKELEAEPKVLDLLAYLYLHQDRYISLQELHQQVWPGRVVSDTAVRGTIKKLRNLLNDTDIAEPKYIKSLSKRGYKLVCHVADIADAATADTVLPTASGVVVDMLQVSGGYADALEQPIVTSSHPGKWIALAILLFLGAFIIWYSEPWSQDIPMFDQPPLAAQVIPTITGEKRGLAVSPDGTYLAFIGRQNQSEPWKVYLMDRQSRDIRLLPVTTQQPAMLVFADNQSLFVVDQMMGDSAIYRLQLNEKMQVIAEKRLASFPFISNLSPVTETRDWLINAADDVQSAVKLYRWHAGSDQLQLLQARSSALEHIYRSVYSPSGRWLANAVFTNGTEFRLEVQDTQSKQIVYAEKTTDSVSRMEWLAEDTLILLDDKQGLVVVELASNNQRVLMEHGDGKIENFAVVEAGQRLVLLRNEYLSEPVFHELILSPEVSMGRIINVPSGLRMLNYAENEQWHFGLTRQQDKRQLVKYHQQSAKKEVLLHTDHPIEILEHHPQQNALLLQVGQQLMVLSIDNNSVELVSSSQSYLDSHAAFSLDGNYVYFGQLIAGEWELHQFERANQRSRQLIKGYRAARQTPQGYIAASGRGDLYQLDSQFRQLNALGYSINTELISRWYVKQQRIIWSDFDLASTWINQLDLNSGMFQQSRFPYEKIFPRFAINQNGSQILSYSLGSRSSNLSEVDLSSLPSKK